jgi:hypothetical protein
MQRICQEQLFAAKNKQGFVFIGLIVLPHTLFRQAERGGLLHHCKYFGTICHTLCLHEKNSRNLGLLKQSWPFCIFAKRP